MMLRLCLTIVGLSITRCTLADDPPKLTDKPGSTAAPQSNRSNGDTKRQIAPDDANLLKKLEKQSAPTQVDTNPLERIDQHMRDVQDRLAKSDAGDDTQVIQKQIVDDLASLIEQAKKNENSNKQQGKQKRQTSSKQAAQQGKSNNQASEPQDGVAARPGEISDQQKAADARLVRAIWGHLPEKMREEMQQASQDSGLPKYRSLIDLYFRAIAEQNDSRRHANP